MDVRGANTFPLHNRLPNPIWLRRPFLFYFCGFYRYFPFPSLGINKVRWRLCFVYISSVPYAWVFFAPRQLATLLGNESSPKRVNPNLVYFVLECFFYLFIYFLFVLSIYAFIICISNCCIIDIWYHWNFLDYWNLCEEKLYTRAMRKNLS